jgi:uncharacterized protein YaaN involved in tellurite resistance
MHSVQAHSAVEGPTKIDPTRDDGPKAQLSTAAKAKLTELDTLDAQSLMFFGGNAQEQLTTVSHAMLEQVRAKDLGTAGDALNDMVLTLRGFDRAAAGGAKPAGWLGRLVGKTRSAAKMLQRYEATEDQIEAIGARLQRHQNDLLVDIEALDRLYSANLSYVHELESYIDAGDAKLADLGRRLLPAAQKEVSENTLAAQQLRDLRAARDALERRIHDLRLTRQVALQTLPSIRLVQDNDKALVAKIDSTLVNTVPLWRQQLAQAVTIQRSKEAAETISAATQLTNDLLRANAENLREANRQTRQQVERGVFDIDVIAEANRQLIATIEDSLRIAEEGRKARGNAVGELRSMEDALRGALRAASPNG